jgi:hypothetical protein
MANEYKHDLNSDEKDPSIEGSTLSGSRVRDNASTDKALHPKPQDQSSDVDELVDQSPGERQKENQNQQKDDPLAA